MQLDPRVFLEDIEQAGSDMERFIEHMDEAAYAAAAQTQAAVERKLGIIGEAINRSHEIHPELAARIPRMRQTIDFRNLLIHNYKIVAPNLVWDYAKKDLPQLRQTVQKLITESGPQEE